MAKAELKTKKTRASVAEFIKGVEDDRVRKECRTVMKIMKEATGAPARMWGPSIVGFGSYHYRYASGREGDWFLTGFAPRKGNLTLYIMSGFREYEGLMKRLGKHRTGKSCLYVKSLEDVDMKVLTDLVRKSVSHMRKRNA